MFNIDPYEKNRQCGMLETMSIRPRTACIGEEEVRTTLLKQVADSRLSPPPREILKQTQVVGISHN